MAAFVLFIQEVNYTENLFQQMQYLIQLMIYTKS